jgi:hypothetical protein
MGESLETLFGHTEWDLLGSMFCRPENRNLPSLSGTYYREARQPLTLNTAPTWHPAAARRLSKIKQHRLKTTLFG